MQNQLLIEIFAISIGFILSIEDFIKQSVNVLLLILFFSLCFGLFFIKDKTGCIYPPAIFAIIGAIYWRRNKKHAFGMGDYIFITGISLIINCATWPLFLILSGVFGIFISIANQKSDYGNTFPFIPAMFAAFLILYGSP